MKLPDISQATTTTTTDNVDSTMINLNGNGKEDSTESFENQIESTNKTSTDQSLAMEFEKIKKQSTLITTYLSNIMNDIVKVNDMQRKIESAITNFSQRLKYYQASNLSRQNSIAKLCKSNQRIKSLTQIKQDDKLSIDKLKVEDIQNQPQDAIDHFINILSEQSDFEQKEFDILQNLLNLNSTNNDDSILNINIKENHQFKDGINPFSDSNSNIEKTTITRESTTASTSTIASTAQQIRTTSESDQSNCETMTDISSFESAKSDIEIDSDSNTLIKVVQDGTNRSFDLTTFDEEGNIRKERITLKHVIQDELSHKTKSEDEIETFCFPEKVRSSSFNCDAMIEKVTPTFNRVKDYWERRSLRLHPKQKKMKF